MPWLAEYFTFSFVESHSWKILDRVTRILKQFRPGLMLFRAKSLSLGDYFSFVEELSGGCDLVWVL